MKILFDTNVVLGLLMDRATHADLAAELFSRVEEGAVIGCLCGTTVTTVLYIAAKTVGNAAAREEIGKLLGLFEAGKLRTNRNTFKNA